MHLPRHVVLAAFALLPALHAADEAATRVDSLLAAMGGRDAWARTRFVHVAATHYTDGQPAPYANRIWNDFTAPRVRFSATIGGEERVYAIDGTSGWRHRGGTTTPLTEEQLAQERAWWESNVYRTLHRLAVHDPELTTRAAGEDRLEVFRVDGTRLCWFRLNPRGAPVLFGTWDNETGTIFGPLVTASSGGVKHGRWGTSGDGAFRYEITRFEAASTAPADVSFSAP